MSFSSRDLPFFIDTESEFYDIVDKRSSDKKLVDEVRHLRNEQAAINAMQIQTMKEIADQEKDDRLHEEIRQDEQLLEQRAMEKAKMMASVAASRHTDEQKALEAAERVFEQVFASEKARLIEEEQARSDEEVRKAIEDYNAQMAAEAAAKQAEQQAKEDAKRAKQAAAAKKRTEFKENLWNCLTSPKKPLEVEMVQSAFKQVKTRSFWSSCLKFLKKVTMNLLKAVFVLFLCVVIILTLIVVFT